MVKICGLTRPSEAAACAARGAWAVGVVFWPGSPRRVDPERAATILAGLPPATRRVGVFVDADPDDMAEVASRCGLTHLQVQEGTDPAAARGASGLPVIQAFRVDGPAALERAEASTADLVMLDAAGARPGGTGRTFDWRLLAARPLSRPFALAGGLTPENVAEAVERMRPAVVDVSTGVESAPGRKDPARVGRFVRAVRQGARRAA
jgi:phosphoribosylanthranilate isomerase